MLRVSCMLLYQNLTIFVFCDTILFFKTLRILRYSLKDFQTLYVNDRNFWLSFVLSYSAFDRVRERVPRRVWRDTSQDCDMTHPCMTWFRRVWWHVHAKSVPCNAAWHDSSTPSVWHDSSRCDTNVPDFVEFVGMCVISRPVYSIANLHINVYHARIHAI